jgi:hypothetical protein
MYEIQCGESKLKQNGYTSLISVSIEHPGTSWEMATSRVIWLISKSNGQLFESSFFSESCQCSFAGIQITGIYYVMRSHPMRAVARNRV